jgi:acetyl esterase/lipase
MVGAMSTRILRPIVVGLVMCAVVVVSAGAGQASTPRLGGGEPVEPDGCREQAESIKGLQYDSIEGVEANALSLDLHLPATGKACEPAPLVVGVHGGGWVIGDKRGFTGDKATLFNEQGWAFANLNYRLSARDQVPRVRYPTHNEDVARAVAWLFEHADEFGLDPDRVAIMGHSAGAQIVASITTDEHYLEGVGLGLDRIRCSFPDDTEGFDVEARVAGGNRGARLYAAIFGTDPAVQRDASPLRHVERGKDIPPMLLVQRGEPSRVAQLEEFADALRAADVDVEVIDASGYSHRDVNHLIGSTTDPVMTKPVTAFLEDCFDR